MKEGRKETQKGQWPLHVSSGSQGQAAVLEEAAKSTLFLKVI